MTHKKKVKTMVLKIGMVNKSGKGPIPRFSQLLTGFDRFLAIILVFTIPVQSIRSASIFLATGSRFRTQPARSASIFQANTQTHFDQW